jgi:HD-GYP domain-containing protein (c-di-GMP phosphodiesterase class II)
MRLTHIARVRAGTKLAEPVWDSNGLLLLADGIQLTPGHLAQLRALGRSALYVEDGDTSDIVPTPPIRPEVRQAAVRNLTRSFATVTKSLQELRVSFASLARANFRAGPLADCLKSLSTDESLHRTFKDVTVMIDDLMQRDVLLGLNSIKSHDTYTFQHSIDVTVMALVLARKAGWDKARLRSFGIGCILHDVGKICVEAAVLNKPAKLTDAEYEQVKAHPTVGYEVIRGVAPGLGYLVPHVAYQHHERQDGTGYPRGLKGDNGLGENPAKMIHDFGAVAAVADVYDALTSDRPYRPGIPCDRAVTMIARDSGSHFNSEVVKIFKSVVPPYPLSSEVRVMSGAYAGYAGVVSAVSKGDLARPKVRVLFDAEGRRVEPVEIDLRVERDVKIEAGSCEPRQAAARAA